MNTQAPLAPPAKARGVGGCGRAGRPRGAHWLVPVRHRSSSPERSAVLKRG